MDVSVAGHTLTIADHRINGTIRRDVARYLEGERIDFSHCRINLSGLTPFQRRVVEAIRGIGYGETAAYGDLATRIGKPDAARAVASACGTNPCPIIIPCHRVVAKQGLGGYSSGVDVKRALLRLEGVDV